MPRPGREALALGESLRLALAHEPRRGLAGEHLGRGTGSSLEFQDRRAYQPGDDVRHLDWRAYGRTDQLLVRQYREEVLPRLELLLDDSRSMASDERKAAVAVDLAAVFLGAARASGYEVRLHALGERAERLEPERFEREGLSFEGRRPLADAVHALAPRLAPGSLRVLVSDFLSPHRADVLVRNAAREAGGLVLLQVLSDADAAPEVGRAVRLVDAETDEVLDLVVDARVRERYLARLAAMGEALAEEATRSGGRFLSLASSRGVVALVRADLVGRGVLGG